MNSIKIIFLLTFFSLLICQESSFYKSYKKQGSFVISGSLFGTLAQDSNNNESSRELKLDYKMRGPLGVWFSVLNNEKNNINIGTLGLGYFFKTKKWDLALLTEKSFYDKDYTDVELSENQEFYEYKLGWLYHLKKNIPFYLKYVNSYHKSVNNSYNKKDYLFIGSYSFINKILLSYNIGMKVEDLLKLDFNTGKIGITFGYKF